MCIPLKSWFLRERNNNFKYFEQLCMSNQGMKTQYFDALINYIVNPFTDEIVNKTMVIFKNEWCSMLLWLSGQCTYSSWINWVWAAGHTLLKERIDFQVCLLASTWTPWHIKTYPHHKHPSQAHTLSIVQG